MWWKTTRIKAACHRSSRQATTKPVLRDGGRKMDKNGVTRTFSIGAICSGTNASEDFSTARRHSSAGIRGLLWATSSAKSLGGSTDSQTSRENIFPNILTPDSIPQFTIPTLSLQNSLRSESQGGARTVGTEPDSVTSASSSFSNLHLAVRRAERSVSDPLSKTRSLLDYNRPCKPVQHCLDPASRAALSLPHLAKVTTPYGFVTLSQSPQMATEEALLCQAGRRRLNRDDRTSCSPGKAPETNAGDIKGNSSRLSGAKKKLSRDSADSKGRSVRGELQASPASFITASASSSSAPKHPDVKLKRRFYEVIRKHFISRH